MKSAKSGAKTGTATRASRTATGGPGKRSRVSARYASVSGRAPVQAYGGAIRSGNIGEAVESGFSGCADFLPGLDQIQQSFGKHDVSEVQAFRGAQADAANDALGSRAFASGDKVALSQSADLHTAAHEAAHVVQQRHGAVPSGGVGRPGDALEHHADAVADRVVQGQSAEPLLDSVAGGGAPATGVQFDGGGEGLVRFIQVRAAMAQAGYDLMYSQLGVITRQIGLLEMYAGTIEGDNDPQLTSAKQSISDTAERVRGAVVGFPQECSEARATAVALGQSAKVTTPLELLDEWSQEAVRAVGVVAMTQAKTAGILDRMRNDAVTMAGKALAAHEQHMMRGLLKVADECDAAARSGDAEVQRLNSMDTPRSSGKEKLGLATTIGDSVNNAATGIAFGTVGALDAGNVFSLSTGAANAMGVIGGVLGILFGSIGTFLGVKNAIRGGMARSRLKTAKSNLTNEGELEEIADFAIDQKGKKIARNTAGAVGGLIAIGAGVIGLVALSVATLGVAAIVAGITAALIGLGFVGYKVIKHWWKRRNERKEFADQLISEIENKGENETQARDIVMGVGLNPDDAGNKKFRKQLTGRVGDYIKSKRTTMAEGLVEKVINGKPSEKFDAELILNALGVDPEWVRNKVTGGKVNTAVNKVANKMSSW